MVSGFLKEGRNVRSVMIPFYSDQTNNEITKCFVIGEDIPYLDDYSEFEFENITQDGVVYEPEVDPTTLLAFLEP